MDISEKISIMMLCVSEMNFALKAFPVKTFYPSLLFYSPLSFSKMHVTILNNFDH